ncbi:MAG: hypothetical protein M9936_00335 [Caldilinea sp.]|nr:hypothetical protein [Caldilineaceae bacterium]MCB9123785.1 hypothetical protein [Caldilineaceae bacterium]MCO5208110.1 hypothetical protein [Caldilinea sp.]MCW5842823.1 hypothetical protein [Caldilinea sp.]
MSAYQIRGTLLRLPTRLFFCLSILLSISLSLHTQADAAHQHSVSAAPYLQRAGTEGTLGGAYIGTIAISEPASLGVMDLAVDLSAVEEGGLSGTIDSTRTQAFPGSPVLSGSITSATDAITPTFSISGTFGSVTAGRTISRTVTLEGDVLDQGDTLRGIYSERIEGFTRKPLNVQGAFLLVRPASPTAEGK